MRTKKYILIGCLIFLTLFPSVVFAQIAGRLTKVEGRVDILRAGATAVAPVKVNDPVSVGDIVRTKSDGRAEITFVDSSVITVGPKSRLGIDEYTFSPEAKKRVASLNLHRGKMGFEIPKPVYEAEGSKFEMKMRTTVAGVRGTAGLNVNVVHPMTFVTQGTVEFKNPMGSTTLQAGMVGEARAGMPPVSRPFSQSELNKAGEGVKTSPQPSSSSASGGGGSGQTGGSSTAESPSSSSAAAVDAPPPPPPPALASGSAIPVSVIPGGSLGAIASMPPLPPPIPPDQATGMSSNTTRINISIIHP